MTKESFEDRLSRWSIGELRIEQTKKNIYSEGKLNRIQTRIAELEYGDNSRRQESADMRIFLSWSGEASHAIACLLRDWLPTVLPEVSAWVSSIDIDKGARWSTEISVELERSNYGIICLVPENLQAPWLNFEAGAISKSLENGRVAPLAVGLSKRDVSGPLAQFQVTEFEESDFLKLVKSINKSTETPLSDDDLGRNFRNCWPTLENSIGAIDLSSDEVSPDPQNASNRDVADVQADILKWIFELNQNVSIQAISGQFSLQEGLAQYHIDQLRELDLITDGPLIMNEPRTYRLSTAGRKFVVERTQ